MASSVENPPDAPETVVWGSGNPERKVGAKIGEGELATTHMIVQHTHYAPGGPLRRWMVTSTDTDQAMHVLLAMATEAIPWSGSRKMEVQVRQKKGKGSEDFILVNRMYDAVRNKDKWSAGAAGGRRALPWWLTEAARGVLFVVLYFLAGCDFLPAMYNMGFKRMLHHVRMTVAMPGLFAEPIVSCSDGRWRVHTAAAVKMLCVCYFEEHVKVFEPRFPGGAADLFRSAEVAGDTRKFAHVVQDTIWTAKGAAGKKNCPRWDALELHVRRADAVLEYWQGALELETPRTCFEGRGWSTTDGDDSAQLTNENVVFRLSPHALLTQEGRVRLLKCQCKPATAARDTNVRTAVV